MFLFKLNLHMFDGEGGAEGGSAPAGNAEGNPELANQGADLDAEYKELIGGKYKAQHDKYMQDTINARFRKNDAQIKGMQADVDAYAKAKPMIEMLKTKYGVESDKIEDIVSAIEDDDSMYEEEAYEKGLPVSELKRFKKLERENEALRLKEEERTNKEIANAKVSKWVAEAEELKRTFPSFDLNMEAQNPDFFNMINNGVSVAHAFKVIHMDELDAAKTSLVAKETEKRISQTIQSGKNRPSESGSKTSSPVKTSVDIHSLTDEQMKEYERRAMLGEEISFK